MLGSLAEADDALQEAWLRLHRVESARIGNPGGWLTTVVSHVCLDMLRSRKSRREEPPGAREREPSEAGDASGAGAAPARDAVLADSVGVALLAVLETLAPAERLAFVLHDLFAMPFEEIAPIVGRAREVRGAAAWAEQLLAPSRGLRSVRPPSSTARSA